MDLTIVFVKTTLDKKTFASTDCTLAMVNEFCLRVIENGKTEFRRTLDTHDGFTIRMTSSEWINEENLFKSDTDRIIGSMTYVIQHLR
jgi:hypothetical protein